MRPSVAMGSSIIPPDSVLSTEGRGAGFWLVPVSDASCCVQLLALVKTPRFPGRVITLASFISSIATFPCPPCLLGRAADLACERDESSLGWNIFPTGGTRLG